MSAPNILKRWSPFIFMGSCLLAALYLLTFSLQDYDTFWHLAYGRAMVETGTFINHEIFSYTAQGKYLGSHSQLAQVILYALWVVGGANALLIFKLLVATVVFALVVKMARLFGVDTIASAILALSVLIVGMSRIVERPELFSIVLQALLIWILFRARGLGYPARWLWMIPPIMVLWDYLHGALYGLIILCVFTGMEVCKLLVLPKLGIAGPDDGSRPAIRRLLIWSVITLAAMLVHPNGLLNYAHFWRVGTAGHEYRMYGEWMSPHFAQFGPYWIFLAIALLVIAAGIRHVDPTALAILVPFLYLSLTYNRAVLAFALAAVPALAQALGWLQEYGRKVRWADGVPLVLGICLLGGTVVYKQQYVVENHRFGTGLNDLVFPVGSVRFVQDNGLSGNMYNMDAFGGYLAFVAGPDRKIFNYNQPGVFTALFDYLHKPETRAQWAINYAFLGSMTEIGAFENDGFVPVYWEPGSAVYLRVNEANARLIDQFQLHYFRPLLSNEEIMAFGRDKRSAARFLREMGDYLNYREDRRIASLFAQLLRESPGVVDDQQRAALLTPAMKYNAESVDLLSSQGELSYRKGDLAAAEELFARVLARTPESFPARIGLGYVYYDRRQFEKAAEQFAMLSKDHPQSAEAHYAHGLALFRLCRRQQAGEEFAKFLELAPDSPYAVKAKEFLKNTGERCAP